MPNEEEQNKKIQPQQVNAKTSTRKITDFELLEYLKATWDFGKQTHTQTYT